VYFIWNRETIFGSQESVVINKDNDGVVWQLGLGQDDAGYQHWVAEGNTAEEWSPNGNQ
jgi:hypothetical protein